MSQPKTFRFLHLFTTSRGGAGRAAWRLHQGLRMAGQESRAIMLELPLSDRDSVLAAVGGRIFKLRRLFKKALLKLLTRQDYGFSDELLSPTLGRETLNAASAFGPDVIIVHAISDFLAPADVLALHEATSAKVIWYLMDMASMTGGCHYAWNCRNYQTACTRCPALRLASDSDIAKRAWRAKAAIMARIEGVVVAGSSMLAAQARASALFRDCHIENVMVGLMPEEFAPRGRAAERLAFGINSDGPVIFFGAQSFHERRKGMSILADTLRRLPALLPSGAPRPLLLTAGNMAGFPHLRSLGYEYRNLGYIDAQTLARAYAAADVFACPSIEDSGPMMVNEALMSGTPVVAFRQGVAPDLVEPGVTGEIADLGDAASLARCLASVLAWDAERRAEARRRCRAVALGKSASDVQIQRFIEIAESMIPVRKIGV